VPRARFASLTAASAATASASSPNAPIAGIASRKRSSSCTICSRVAATRSESASSKRGAWRDLRAPCQRRDGFAQRARFGRDVVLALPCAIVSGAARRPPVRPGALPSRRVERGLSSAANVCCPFRVRVRRRRGLGHHGHSPLMRRFPLRAAARARRRAVPLRFAARSPQRRAPRRLHPHRFGESVALDRLEFGP